MILRLAIGITFLLALNSDLHAGCGGPILSSTFSGYCPNGTPVPFNGVWMSADTIHSYVGPNDTINFLLQANSDCPHFDSVQWYKDGQFILQAPTSSLMDYTFSATGPGTYTCKFKMQGWISYTIYIPSTSLNVLVNEISDLSVYPNPVHGFLNISASDMESFTINIYDISGKTITTLTCVELPTTLDLSGINPGFYSLVLTDDRGRKQVKKIILN
jgi:hypothetical protein